MFYMCIYFEVLQLCVCVIVLFYTKFLYMKIFFHSFLHPSKILILTWDEISVYMFFGVSLLVSTYMCVSACVSMSLCIYLYVCLRKRAYVHVNVCMCVRACGCVFVCTFARVWKRAIESVSVSVCLCMCKMIRDNNYVIIHHALKTKCQQFKIMYCYAISMCIVMRMHVGALL